MLNILNRTEVFMTYSKTNLDKVLRVLDTNGIEYVVKTTKTLQGYDQGDDTMNIGYKVYTTYRDVQEAQRYVTSALFMEDE